MSTRRKLEVVVGCLLAMWPGASATGESASRLPAQGLAARWSAIPPDELRKLWAEAQDTGGVIAVEPDTQVVGLRAGQKKTWTLADKLLKFFVYGNQPNWFPADIVRRTVCGGNPRWSYFWHHLSGDERDTHPWIAGEKGFGDLLGPASGAVTESGALDLSSCDEVQGPAKPCLYGEVTPPEGFEQWFCGGRGQRCRSWLTASPQEVPADLRRPGALCMYGPWVLERVHGWRPEIHPAEVLWTRANPGQNRWAFALAPDDSERFDRDNHFDRTPTAPPWRPWSSERPVELWVAFTSGSGSPVAFDLSVKLFDKRPQAARQVTLTPPPAGAGFTVLPHPLPGFEIAATSWADPSCGCDRGLLVLRTTIRKKDQQALVARLVGRPPTDPPPPAELEAVSAPREALVAPAPAVVPALRLFGVTRQGLAARPGWLAINTLVRFDPRRPSEPADELATDRKNEALKAKAADRVREFGKERPFRVEWDLTATRDDTGGPVPVVTSGLGADAEVDVVSFPGPATSGFLVNGQDLTRALTTERTLVSLGQLMIRVPPGVTVIGQGRVHYEGTVPLGLSTPATRVAFRIPRRQYAGEWDLVSEALAEIEPASAAARLEALKADACAPAPPADCALMPLSAGTAARLADPVGRWAALRELHTGLRPFARFVRLFARGLLWDGDVADDEREALKRLLQSAERGRP